MLAASDFNRFKRRAGESVSVSVEGREEANT
jgi:hypothetical protein